MDETLTEEIDHGIKMRGFYVLEHKHYDEVTGTRPYRGEREGLMRAFAKERGLEVANWGGNRLTVFSQAQ